MHGEIPVLDRRQSDQLLDRLHEDLRRQADPGFVLSRDYQLQNPGEQAIHVPLHVANGNRQCAIALCHPLTPGRPTPKEVAELAEFGTVPTVLVDALSIRLNLPRVTSSIIERL